MIELVASDEHIRILKPWYDRRSSTAHAGRYHGVEPAYGSLFDLGPGMAMPNRETVVGDLGVQRFVLLVAVARGVVADLLRRALET